MVFFISGKWVNSEAVKIIYCIFSYTAYYNYATISIILFYISKYTYTILFTNNNKLSLINPYYKLQIKIFNQSTELLSKGMKKKNGSTVAYKFLNVFSNMKSLKRQNMKNQNYIKEEMGSEVKKREEKHNEGTFYSVELKGNNNGKYQGQVIKSQIDPNHQIMNRARPRAFSAQITNNQRIALGQSIGVLPMKKFTNSNWFSSNPAVPTPAAAVKINPSIHCFKNKKTLSSSSYKKLSEYVNVSSKHQKQSIKWIGITPPPLYKNFQQKNKKKKYQGNHRKGIQNKSQSINLTAPPERSFSSKISISPSKQKLHPPSSPDNNPNDNFLAPNLNSNHNYNCIVNLSSLQKQKMDSPDQNYSYTCTQAFPKRKQKNADQSFANFMLRYGKYFKNIGNQDKEKQWSQVKNINTGENGRNSGNNFNLINQQKYVSNGATVKVKSRLTWFQKKKSVSYMDYHFSYKNKKTNQVISQQNLSKKQSPNPVLFKQNSTCIPNSSQNVKQDNKYDQFYQQKQGKQKIQWQKETEREKVKRYNHGNHKEGAKQIQVYWIRHYDK